MLTEYVNPYMHTQTPEEDELAICKHKADDQLHVWRDV